MHGFGASSVRGTERRHRPMGNTSLPRHSHVQVRLRTALHWNESALAWLGRLSEHVLFAQQTRAPLLSAPTLSFPLPPAPTRARAAVQRGNRAPARLQPLHHLRARVVAAGFQQLRKRSRAPLMAQWPLTRECHRWQTTSCRLFADVRHCMMHGAVERPARSRAQRLALKNHVDRWDILLLLRPMRVDRQGNDGAGALGAMTSK